MINLLSVLSLTMLDQLLRRGPTFSKPLRTGISTLSLRTYLRCNKTLHWWGISGAVRVRAVGRLDTLHTSEH